MGMEIVLVVPDGTLGDVGQGEARFSPFGDSTSLDARLVHGSSRTCNRLGSHFGAHPMELLGDVGQVEADFLMFGDSVNLGTRYVHSLR